MLECLIRSLNKHTDCKIHVFDNSDEYPYRGNHKNVEVIDNTEGQYVNFGEWLKQFPERRTSARANFGSAKHCKSVDVCFDLLPKGFILMDSDVLVKKDISDFWDDRYAWVGEAKWETHEGVRVMRLLPFLCYINVPMLKKNGIKFFNGNWMWHLRPTTPNKYYDTGAWFLKACSNADMPQKQMGSTSTSSITATEAMSSSTRVLASGLRKGGHYGRCDSGAVHGHRHGSPSRLLCWRENVLPIPNVLGQVDAHAEATGGHRD